MYKYPLLQTHKTVEEKLKGGGEGEGERKSRYKMIHGAPCKNAFLPACRAFLPALFDCVHVHVYMPLVLKTRGNHSGSALFFKKRKGGGTRAATHCIGKRS